MVAALDKMNLAWGDVRAAADTVAIGSVQARGSVTEVDDRAGGSRPIPQSPYRFRNSDAQVQGGAPHLGEHNTDVLREWLGMNNEDIESFNTVMVEGARE